MMTKRIFSALLAAALSLSLLAGCGSTSGSTASSAADMYITGETSPLKTWENMIPDIHGEHFRLTDAQWKYLSDTFKIEGVPTYLIVDREGNTTFRQTGFPGVEKMKEELLKVTK